MYRRGPAGKKGPVRYLEPYTEEHAHLFFGREHDVRALYRLAMDPRQPPVILLLGASGVGKTSLLRAGLMPRLASQRTVVHVRCHGPGHPAGAEDRAGELWP